jgi:hypothetical protein
VPLLAYESPMQVLAEVRRPPDDHRRRAGADRDDTAPWWPLLASGRARPAPTWSPACPSLVMPNARARGTSALVLARIEPEESGEDRALISVEVEEGISRNRIAGP